MDWPVQVSYQEQELLPFLTGIWSLCDILTILLSPKRHRGAGVRPESSSLTQ